MIVKKGLLLCCICFSMCLLSCNHNNEVGVQDVTKDTVTSKIYQLFVCTLWGMYQKTCVKQC